MKKIYEAPTSELIVVATSDIITVSLPGMDGDADPYGADDIAEISIPGI